MLFDIIANTKTLSLHFTVKHRSFTGLDKKVEKILFHLEHNENIKVWGLELTREERDNRHNNFAWSSSVADTSAPDVILTNEERKIYQYTVNSNGVVKGNHKEVNNLINQPELTHDTATFSRWPIKIKPKTPAIALTDSVQTSLELIFYKLLSEKINNNNLEFWVVTKGKTLVSAKLRLRNAAIEQTIIKYMRTFNLFCHSGTHSDIAECQARADHYGVKKGSIIEVINIEQKDIIKRRASMTAFVRNLALNKKVLNNPYFTI